MSTLLIEFECRGYRFAIPASKVRRVLPSAEPTPLPGAPDVVLGLLNVGGEVVIILNFSQRVGLPSAAIGITQQFLLVNISGVCAGLIVDQVTGVVARDIQHPAFIPESLSGAEFVHAIVKLDDGLCVICDPEKLLLDDEKTGIAHVLGNALNAGH